MNILLGIWRDLIHAGRSLAKARAFTFVCVVTLGIGMAPVIAIHFGTQALTTPPPSVKTEGLVEAITTRVGPHAPTDKWSYPDFIDLRDAETGVSFTGWAKGATEITLPDSGGANRVVETMFVSANYFRTIGITLLRGAGFQQTADPEVILVYSFWQKRLAADPDIVGKTLTLNGLPHVVAGVAPDGFESHLSLQETELFLPLERHPVLLRDTNVRFDRSNTWVHIHGRLSPGVSGAQAGAAFSAVTAGLASNYPATNEFKAGIVAPYHPVGNVEGSELPIVLTVFHVLSVIPLLVVCLNVAGMVQVRSAMRERELSIRQAIGATRTRLIQHLLAEAVVLAGAGAALMLIVLYNISPLASWWAGEPLPVQLEDALRVDLSMIATCAGLCLATSLVFGWLPALRFSRPMIMTVLKDEAGSGGLRVGRIHRVTTALQVAITVPLLVVSFMSLERYRATASANLGFAAELLYAAPIELKSGAREDSGFQIRWVRDNLAQASGVVSVTVADGVPLDSRYRVTRVTAQEDANVRSKPVAAHVTRVGDGYLETMGIPLVRGRGITTGDSAGAEMVTVLSKALADTLFPETDAIGKRLTLGAAGDTGRMPKTLTVVGVSADFPTAQINSAREQILLPLAQHPDVRRDSVPLDAEEGVTPMLMLIARSAAGEPAMKLRTAFENAVRDVDPDFRADSIVTGSELRQRSMDNFLDQFVLTGISSGVTLLLAALGIYGVVGLMVATRTREIAVRVAIGASRPRVIGMILFGVVKLVAPGVGAGMLITAAVVQLQDDISISNIEPLAYVAGAAIAILTAVAASLAHARRAASVQPTVAMRST